MNLLYIEPGGRVRAGRLDPGEASNGDAPPVVVGWMGEVRQPDEVLALLAPHTPTEDQRALLWQAVRAGYRVENA